MERLTYLLLLFTSICFAQDLKCEDFKEGTFILHSESPNATFKVVRKDNAQTEELITGSKEYTDIIDRKRISGVLKWTDDCSYKMTFDSKKSELDKYEKIINDNGGILVEIDSIKGRCSYYKSSININGELMIINGKMCKE